MPDPKKKGYAGGPASPVPRIYPAPVKETTERTIIEFEKTIYSFDPRARVEVYTVDDYGFGSSSPVKQMWEFRSWVPATATWSTATRGWYKRFYNPFFGTIYDPKNPPVVYKFHPPVSEVEVIEDPWGRTSAEAAIPESGPITADSPSDPEAPPGYPTKGIDFGKLKRAIAESPPVVDPVTGLRPGKGPSTGGGFGALEKLLRELFPFPTGRQSSKQNDNNVRPHAKPGSQSGPGAEGLPHDPAGFFSETGEPGTSKGPDFDSVLVGGEHVAGPTVVYADGGVFMAFTAGQDYFSPKEIDDFKRRMLDALGTPNPVSDPDGRGLSGRDLSRMLREVRIRDARSDGPADREATAPSDGDVDRAALVFDPTIDPMPTEAGLTATASEGGGSAVGLTATASSRGPIRALVPDTRDDSAEDETTRRVGRFTTIHGEGGVLGGVDPHARLRSSR